MTHQSTTSVNPYREKMRDLNISILSCPNYQNVCKNDLKPGYQPGPEISFVGKRYGEGVRIVFVRVNPNWNESAPSLGTAETVSAMTAAKQELTYDELLDTMRDYWVSPFNGRLYQGYNCMNTIVGHGNYPIRDIGEFLRRPPRYGAKLILQELENAGVFLSGNSDLLDFCAITNVTKCSGNLRQGNPTPGMQRACHSIHRDEMRILEPQIVITFGGSAEVSKVTAEMSKISQAYNFPHPAFRPHIWAKTHRPVHDSGWHGNEEYQYKKCMKLRDDIKAFAQRVQTFLTDKNAQAHSLSDNA